jgi:phenylpyruvate tautomerase PptA (4-oxalocrotonate tautomerase family)
MSISLFAYQSGQQGAIPHPSKGILGVYTATVRLWENNAEAEMPLYRLCIQDGSLSLDRRAALAKEITDLHCRISGVEKAWVKIIFETFSPSEGFVGGEAAAAVILVVLIRVGRSTDYKTNMLRELWSTLKRTTGAPDSQILIAIEEAPASQAMEMGMIMPDLHE